MPTAESVVLIARPAAAVFAVLDDTSRAPEWLESCVSLQSTAVSAKAVGATLDYHFRQGGHTGRMAGVVTGYAPGQSLGMRFTDPKFTVEVSFSLAPSGPGTEVRHAINIRPGSLIGRLMSPLIQLGNRKQVANNLERLKRLVEAG